MSQPNLFDIVPIWLRLVTNIPTALLLLGHLFCPILNFDWIGIALLGLALLPWFIHLLRSVKLPGGTQIDLGASQQSATDRPAPPSDQSTPGTLNLQQDVQATKILKTLWKYQKQFFSDHEVKRWTFAIAPQAPNYGHYLTGLAKVVSAGYVSVSPESNHCMLTNEGIGYCKEHEQVLNQSEDLYHF